MLESLCLFQRSLLNSSISITVCIFALILGSYSFNATPTPLRRILWSKVSRVFYHSTTFRVNLYVTLHSILHSIPTLSVPLSIPLAYSHHFCQTNIFWGLQNKIFGHILDFIYYIPFPLLKILFHPLFLCLYFNNPPKYMPFMKTFSVIACLSAHSQVHMPMSNKVFHCWL